MVSDTYAFVRSCDDCQWMKGLPHYHTNMKRPIANMLEFFLIYFAGPIVGAQDGKKKYILICVEHLTNWPIAIIADNATSMEVIRYAENQIIAPFGPPKTIVSDNAGCFTSTALKTFMQGWSIDWKTVLAYAPMSNGRVE